MTVTFQLPCLRPNYANKPEHYISHLVGHEGPGSLLSALKVSPAQLSELGLLGWVSAAVGHKGPPMFLLSAVKVELSQGRSSVVNQLVCCGMLWRSKRGEEKG